MEFDNYFSDDGWWSVLVAFAGVVVSIVLSVASVRQQARMSKESLQEQRSSLRLSWTGNVVDWGQCCLRTLSEIDSLAFLPPEESFSANRHRLLHHLSSLIDEGRLFFMNKSYGDYGKEKPKAYRGLSPKLLDCLKATYLTLEGNGRDREALRLRRSELIDIRREFVSELQAEVDPAWIKMAVLYQKAPAA